MNPPIRTATLLLVRSADEMALSIKDASACSVYQRERFGGEQEDTKLLGVWLRRELDVGLPCLSCRDLVSPEDGAVEGRNRNSEPISTRSDIRIVSSFSLSGVWALCRLEGVSLDDEKDLAEERRAIVQTLVGPHSQGDSVFFPVFQEEESEEQVQAAMRDLREQHPGLIAATCFIDDRKQGLIRNEPYSK